jgi:hypothetical protein
MTVKQEVICNICDNAITTDGVIYRNGNPICEKCSANIVEPIRRMLPKISRNAKCPCGSGLKYKACCGKGL